MDSVVNSYFGEGLAPGMGVAVVKGDEIIYSQGFGFADVEAQREITAETVFYIASTTKSFTALAAAVLAEKGQLNLDAMLSTYLPDAKFTPPLSADSINLRQLLTM